MEVFIQYKDLDEDERKEMIQVVCHWEPEADDVTTEPPACLTDWCLVEI